MPATSSPPSTWALAVLVTFPNRIWASGAWIEPWMTTSCCDPALTSSSGLAAGQGHRAGGYPPTDWRTAIRLTACDPWRRRNSSSLPCVSTSMLAPAPMNHVLP